MKCLDSDVLIAILRGKLEVQPMVDELDNESSGATTAINAYEIYFGANRSQRKEENIKEATKLLERLTIFPLELAAARKAAEISAKLAKKGEAIDFRDAMVAAIALQNGLTLVTRNKVHFGRIRELRMEKW